MFATSRVSFDCLTFQRYIELVYNRYFNKSILAEIVLGIFQYLKLLKFEHRVFILPHTVLSQTSLSLYGYYFIFYITNLMPNVFLSFPDMPI